MSNEATTADAAGIAVTPGSASSTDGAVGPTTAVAPSRRPAPPVATSGCRHSRCSPPGPAGSSA